MIDAMNYTEKNENKYKFLWKVTGSDITKAIHGFDTRIQNLPAYYQADWQEIVICLMSYRDFSGHNLMLISNNLPKLLEICSIYRQKIENIIGNDLTSFVKKLN